MIKKHKKTNNEKIFITCVVALIALTLFTAAQVYYSVYAHLALFVLCYFLCAKEQHHTTTFVGTGIVLCVIFCMMSLMKGFGLAMEHFGLFLHYITWPVLFVFVVHKFSPEEKRKLLLFVVAICIVGDILSLIQLEINPEISRLISGMYSAAETAEYHRKGVGGYGYTYAMAFLTFGIVRWLMVTTVRKDKILLIIFLVINSLFIVRASFTLAIVMAIVMAGFALISGMNSWSRIVIVVLVVTMILIFAQPILQICYDVSSDLELTWVAKRIGQLIDALEKEDASSLRRYELYKESWDTFVARPIFGAIMEKGDTWGGHSQVLDTMAQYGLFSVLLPVFLLYCRRICCKYITNFKLTALFLAFAVFLCIDTIIAMQLPVIVFFVVPLIAYMESEGQLNENRDPNLSLGR